MSRSTRSRRAQHRTDTTTTAADAVDPDTPLEEMTLAPVVMKQRDTQQGSMVAVCDEHDLGKTFSTDHDRVSLTANHDYYGTTVVDPETVLAELRRASNANLVGNTAVKLGMKAGLITPENVIDFGTSKHAQFMSL